MDAFERLDFTIAEAGKRNLKLVIARKDSVQGIYQLYA